MAKWNISKTNVMHLVKAICMTVGVMIVFAVAATVCVEKEYIEMNKIKFFTPCIWFVSMLICAYTTEENGTSLRLAILSASILYVIILLMGVLLYDGLSGIGVLFGAVASVLGIAVGFLLRYRRKGAQRGRKRRRVYR